RVKAAHDSALIGRSAFNCEAPASAPAEFSEPDWSVILVSFACAIDCEPWIRLISRAASPALNNAFANLQFFALDLPFSSPAPGEVMQSIRAVRWKRPGCGLCALQQDHVRCAIFNPS